MWHQRLWAFYCDQISNHVCWVFDYCCAAVEDLVKYLDPEFTEHITVPDSMKLEFILAGKKQEEFKIDKLNKKNLKSDISLRYYLFMWHQICNSNV